MLGAGRWLPVIVAHGLWRLDASGGQLLIWAESADDAPTTRGHPFAVKPPLKGGSPTTVTVSLPTRAGRPLDSPELVRSELRPPSKAAISLRAWEVPARAYDPDEALAALSTPSSEQVTLAADLRHLAQMAAFAFDLATRGRVLPVVVPHDGTALALWRPLLTGPDAAWAQSLALALPPSARAAGGEAASIVGDALNALVDAAVRTQLPVPKREGTGWKAWLAALTGTDRKFKVDDPAALASAVAEWQRDALAGRVRACFRLVEPEDDESDDWRLDFALQAADEPSLVVDADRVWKARGKLAKHFDAPQETLLAELGRASRLYPKLDDALRTAKPATLPLTGEAAHGFLRHDAPLLAGAGFGVLLPRWWTKPRARLGVRLNASRSTAPGTVAGKGALGLEALVDYEWQLALGDEPLTEAELKSLVALKTPLVRLRGQWVELDAKRLAAGLKLLSTRGQMSVAELLQAGMSTGDGPAGLPVVAVEADGALGDLLSGQAERRLEPVAAPDGFIGTLRPYQERGYAWLAFLESLGFGPVLADSMGLGKTIQLLALLQRDAEAGVRPTLLVCPMSLVGNWQREAAKFAPGLRVHVHHGAERARGAKFREAVTGADLVLTTYSLAARDSVALGEVEWHRVVLDEAQAIKNAATRQAVAVRGVPARHRIAVTGTPVENRLADLWSIMDFANPGLLGSPTVFKAKFAEPIEKHGNEAAAERLKRLTGPFILRREKTDKSIISDLPDKIEMEILCNLTTEQASLYQAVVSDMMGQIESSEGIERRGLVLATMTKLKQVCNHPAQLLRDGSRLAGRSGKLARLEEILEEVLADGEKALLFTQYAEFGGMLRAHLAARFGREVAFLHGGVPKTGRDAMVERFQSDSPSAPPLFVLSLKAGGTGLTLTAANHVIHVDRWWNPAVEDQATDRAFRIGQTRNVQVRKFVCAGTVEEKISDMIREKRGLAAKIVGSGEGWITELSTSELRDLFALESKAVVE
jgi:SNF2 domain-containing protein/SNF2 helicase protein/helicase-like protein